MRRVRDGRSSSQGGCDHRGLDHLCIGHAGLARVCAVDLDAIRALASREPAQPFRSARRETRLQQLLGGGDIGFEFVHRVLLVKRSRASAA